MNRKSSDPSRGSEANPFFQWRYKSNKSAPHQGREHPKKLVAQQTIPRPKQVEFPQVIQLLTGQFHMPKWHLFIPITPPDNYHDFLDNQRPRISCDRGSSALLAKSSILYAFPPFSSLTISPAKIQIEWTEIIAIALKRARHPGLADILQFLNQSPLPLPPGSNLLLPSMSLYPSPEMVWLHTWRQSRTR